MLFPTSLVGSYPQPDWLIDRKRLGDRFRPRVRARELWRVDQAYLAQAQQDATLLWYHDHAMGITHLGRKRTCRKRGEQTEGIRDEHTEPDQRVHVG